MAKEIKLSKPLVVTPAMGDAPEVSVDSISLDLEGLNGGHIELASRESTIEIGGQQLTAIVLETTFLAHVAALAAKVPVERLRTLGAVDYLRVTTVVQSFFLAAD